MTHNTFTMSEKEESRFEKFKMKHFVKCGSVASVTFIPTGLGFAVEVCCCKCGKKKNITDYTVW